MHSVKSTSDRNNKGRQVRQESSNSSSSDVSSDEEDAHLVRRTQTSRVPYKKNFSPKPEKEIEQNVQMSNPNPDVTHESSSGIQELLSKMVSTMDVMQSEIRAMKVNGSEGKNSWQQNNSQSSFNCYRCGRAGHRYAYCRSQTTLKSWDDYDWKNGKANNSQSFTRLPEAVTNAPAFIPPNYAPRYPRNIVKSELYR